MPRRPKKLIDQAPPPVMETATKPAQDKVSPVIVGIGSSAGGLEALTQLISALPTNLGVPYVIIQHLSPTHRSMLAQLLGRETAMSVREIDDNSRPEADVVHIAPANRNVVLKDGVFHLIKTTRDPLPTPSANLFFSSLSEEKGEDAIGVILSGTGSDGTAGLRAIKAVGGVAFAQEPTSAKYPGMPLSAIDSGCVDWVMVPEKIAAQIALIAQNRPSVLAEDSPQPVATQLKKLLIRVKQHTRVDFGGYKEATLWRRIERRMAANHINSFDEYVTFAKANTEELERLCKDILISVTAFFRDREVFDHLKDTVRAIVANKRIGDEIRIWVAGCATGEEAYSIAMLLADELGERINDFRVQIFATDIDLNAMNVARKGIYVEGALAEVAPEMVKKYFVRQHDRMEIVRPVRDMVVFARQDLAQDPPFLRLDLVSCRNVLIYLQNELQCKVLSTFHYGLNTDGYLLLGKSETVFQQAELFKVMDKDTHLYRRLPAESRIPISSFHLPDVPVSDTSKSRRTRDSLEQRLLESAIRAYVPATVMVNSALDIQHIFGDVSDYVSIPQGRPSHNLVSMIHRELRTDLQLLLTHAERSMESAMGRPRIIKNGLNEKRLRLAVHPLEKGIRNQQYLVSFEPLPNLEPVEVASSGNLIPINAAPVVKELEEDLLATRERLQTVIEELETSNEEMQALTEEIQSANEELQSSNEELEAANEELQSTNEELTTVNEELQVRSTELAEALNDIENIQNSVGFPIIAVNENLKITRFNAPAAVMFALTQASVGQYISVVRFPRGMSDFSEHINIALATRKSREMPIASDDRCFQLYISPYDTVRTGSRGAIITLVDETERRHNQEKIFTSHQQLLSIMNNSTGIFTLKDLAGRYEFVNHQFEKLFNLNSKDVIGKTDAQLFSTRIADDFRTKEIEVLRKLHPMEFEDNLHIGDRDISLLSVRFPLIGSDNLAYRICTQSTDISARKNAEHQLKLAARVFDRSSEGIMVTDNQGLLITVNESFATVTGYMPEEVLGRNPSLLKSDRHDKQFFQDMWSCIDKHGWWQGEIWNQRKNGDEYPVWMTINAVHDGESNVINYIGIFSDISAIKESQNRIAFLATHDELTELPNRALFRDRVEQLVASNIRDQYPFHVLFIDLDNFKIINDSLGHAAGDALLKEVARRLRECVRTADTVARFGGDEFAMVLLNSSAEETDQAATRIKRRLAEPLTLLGQLIHVSASIGISMFPRDGEDAESLLKNADIAMYHAKENGKGTYEVFNQELLKAVDNRLKMEGELHTAIENNQLELYYQPQVDLVSNQVVGVEALVRWHHPELGILPPARFIPLSEKCGLIEPLGEWIVLEACKQMAQWIAEDRKIPHISINVSAEQFRRGRLLAALQSALSHYQLPPNRLVIELTESALMSDAEHIQQSLHEMKKLGVRISIDDFGTGYSSLAYLKRYPIDELKIDRSFVDDIASGGDDRTITQTIIAMSKTLKMAIVAEGIETAEQLEALRELGCPIGQGYLFSKPMQAKLVVRRFSK